MIKAWERPLLVTHCHFLALGGRKAGGSTRPLNKGAIPREVHRYDFTRLCLHPLYVRTLTCKVWGTGNYSVGNPSKVGNSSKRQKGRTARMALASEETKERANRPRAGMVFSWGCRLTEGRDDRDVTGKVLCHMASGV